MLLCRCGAARFPDIRQCCHAMLAASRFSGLAWHCNQPGSSVVFCPAFFLNPSACLVCLQLLALIEKLCTCHDDGQCQMPNGQRWRTPTEKFAQSAHRTLYAPSGIDAYVFAEHRNSFKGIPRCATLLSVCTEKKGCNANEDE